jgi:hypothetical protein
LSDCFHRLEDSTPINIECVDEIADAGRSSVAAITEAKLCAARAVDFMSFRANAW